MLTPAQQTRLIALEARLDQKLFGRHLDPRTGQMVDDDGSSPLGTAATLGDKMDALSQTKAGGGMGRAYTRMGNLPSLDAAGKLSAGKVATATGAVGQDIWAYLRKQGGRLATKVGLQSRQRLVTLAAKLPEGKTL